MNSATPFETLKQCLFAIKAGQATVDTYQSRGAAYQALGSLAAAAEDYSRALEFDPLPGSAQLAALYNARNECYRQLSRYPEGIADGEAAVALAPECAAYWLNLGHIRYWFKDKRGAGYDLDQALRLDPNLWAAYAVRARLYLLDKLYWKALDDFSKALAHEPSALYYGWRAEAYIAVRGFREAETDCTAGLALDSSDWRLWQHRGYARYYGQLDLGLALTDFTESLRRHSHPDSYLGRGVVYQAIGANTAASHDLNEFVRLHPEGQMAGLKELTAILDRLNATPAGVAPA
jgi:tetratricopeptide (TPR) repeat protein